MSGFFYNNDRQRATSALEALRLYQAAEAAMRRRTRESMSMGENELLVVRQLLRAQSRGLQVKPGDVAKYLGISTASTTSLLDRLESSGYLRRVPHPSDRRSVYLEPTERADEEVRTTLSAMHDRMHQVAADTTAEATEAVIDFLSRMQDAVDSVEPAPTHQRGRDATSVG
ncbi:MarR family winged helix-turn-helix transcriptional regulator [Microbacterium sp. cf332]|uniref:MarR family winged helix-turn-helix transcriptional regulator n=1 Tax=Microbacterium sp. cf332 TaxID=1761804 RepID=UPI00088199E8|nr:MarR family transcriptional regulator [Microbacterium sp. cf332]SDQ81828.1 DNA-binding transcriptional regulator, MarR family [Microbacterium sp. cf332]